MPPAGLPPGWSEGWVRRWWVIREAGILSRRRRRRTSPGTGVHVVQPPGAPHGPLPPARFEASSPARRDTRSPPPSCGRPIPPTYAITTGQRRSAVTRPDHRSRPLTAQSAQPSKLGLTRFAAAIQRHAATLTGSLAYGRSAFTPRNRTCYGPRAAHQRRQAVVSRSVRAILETSCPTTRNPRCPGVRSIISGEVDVQV